MPKGYHRTRMNKYQKAHSVARTGATVASAAFTALKMAKYLKLLLNVERKFHLYTNTINVTNTGAIYFISGIAQGDTAQQRDGNKCKALALHLRSSLYMNGSANRTTARVILFKDKASNGSAPLVTDVLYSASYLQSYNNVNCPYRFKILMDKQVELSSSGTQAVKINRYIKMNHHLTYSGTTAVQADASDGHLYMLLIGNETVNYPSLVVNARITFVDN